MSNKVSKELKKYILSLPKQRKLRMLKDSQEQDKYGVFLDLLDIYLEAPISEGGISSDDIQNYLK